MIDNFFFFFFLFLSCMSCPSCSWVIDTYYSESDIAKLLKLGVYSPNYNNTDGAAIVDVKANRDDDYDDDKFR